MQSTEGTWEKMGHKNTDWLERELIFNNCGTNERFGKRGVRNLPFLF